jgi:hypothetical protein
VVLPQMMIFQNAGFVSGMVLRRDKNPDYKP